MVRRPVGHTGSMASTVDPRSTTRRAAHETRRRAPGAAVVGLVARGVLYLLLAYTAIQVVIGHGGEQVDSRGALHQFAGSAFGTVVLVLMALGFLALAIWNVVDAVTAGSTGDEEAGRRLVDVGRTVVYLALTVATVSVAVSGGDSRTDQKSKTWTATVLGWPAGRLLVGAIGVGVVVAGIVLVVRVFLGRPPEQRSIAEATPNDPRPVHVLGVVGNVARGAVVALVGVFVLAAAIDHDPDHLDGRDVQLGQVAQQPVLVHRQVLEHLLDRVHAAVDPDEPDHVPRDTARQRDQLVFGPVLQRDVPRERQQTGVRAGGDESRHGPQSVRNPETSATYARTYASGCKFLRELA